MARIITTVTTTAKGKLPYHFICNYCGCRNDKVADIAGVSVGGRENAGGALLNLHGEPQRYREKIRAYEQRLRAGKALPDGKFDALDYKVNSLLFLGLDGKCEKCGKEQAWATETTAACSLKSSWAAVRWRSCPFCCSSPAESPHRMPCAERRGSCSDAGGWMKARLSRAANCTYPWATITIAI